MSCLCLAICLASAAAAAFLTAVAADCCAVQVQEMVKKGPQQMMAEMVSVCWVVEAEERVEEEEQVGARLSLPPPPLGALPCDMRPRVMSRTVFPDFKHQWDVPGR